MIALEARINYIYRFKQWRETFMFESEQDDVKLLFNNANDFCVKFVSRRVHEAETGRQYFAHKYDEFIRQ